MPLHRPAQDDVPPAPVFRVLGDTEIHRPGAPVILRRKEKTLLAVLLLRPRERVQFDALADAVWEDQPKNPYRALQTMASRIRTALAPDFPHVIPAALNGYCAEPPPGTLDLDCFRQLAGRADQERARGNLPGAADLLGRALGCWRLPPGASRLPDLPDTPAAAALAAGLLEQRTQLTLRHAGLLIQLGRHDEALPGLFDLAAASPTHEPAAVLLMTALTQAGRPAEALVAYNRTRSALDEELGARPCAELQRTFAQVLQAGAPRWPVTLRPPADGTSPG